MARSTPPKACTDVLDEIEAHLGLIERFLAGDQVQPRTYKKPSRLASLPAEERPRALAIRQATVEMDDQLAAVQQALGTSQPAA